MKTPFVTSAQLEEICAKYPTPFHLYDEAGIRKNARRLFYPDSPSILPMRCNRRVPAGACLPFHCNPRFSYLCFLLRRKTARR